MTHQEISDLQEENGFVVRDIKHVNTQWEEQSLLTFLEEIAGNASWNETFPDVDQGGFSDGDDLRTLLIDESKFGFILEVGFPYKKYRFGTDGEVTSASVYRGVQAIRYAYGDTIDEAYVNAAAQAEDYYNEEKAIQSNGYPHTKH